MRASLQRLALLAMPSRDYHEALWAAIPPGLEPASHAVRASFLTEHVSPAERVLDVGCGEGVFAAELAAAGAEVVGLEVAEEPLRRARARHPELDLRLVDGEGSWPLADASFDVVWAGEVIEHVADTAAWLSELRRVLRSGGKLLLSTPANAPGGLLAAALSRRAFAARFEPRSDHLRFYNRATLTRLLEDFGFENVTVRSVGGFPGARRLLLAHARRSRF
jgi:2-polyprenyl-6-hydroxyphenyl methylase/3-demethylubiquinone-9 3-methyltransferase